MNERIKELILQCGAWNHIVTSYDADSNYTIDSLKTTAFRSYKARWWNKKTYN